MTRSGLATAIATWFGCGLFPVAPGTVGAMAALAIAWLCTAQFGWGRMHWLALVLVFAVPGVWASGEVARNSGTHDPGRVVVDEVLGQWLTLTGMVHDTVGGWILAFGLFRLFDIAKPFPIRRLEQLPGGVGIVADDLGAGVLAALVLYTSGYLRLY